jgi:aryl-alcohol dehydrogenase-like predicted oxidoreductase
MEYRVLGRTGLRASVAGLGCGGSSRLGMAQGRSEAEAARIVRAAIDLGVNFVDTAPVYGTEGAVGLALREVPRDSVIVATKVTVHKGEALATPAEVTASLQESLRRLRTDHVDLLQLHAVRPAAYEHVRETLLPALQRLRQQGKVSHLGITETPPNDAGHLMLQRALDHREWEVFMLAFHMMSQNARTTVFPRTLSQRVGTLVMFAVRSLFSIPGRLQETMRALAAQGRVPAELAELAEPLDFLLHPGGADSVIDAAYRYARHEPGVDVVLFGTGDAAHLEKNIASILAPPLPEADVRRLGRLFGALEGIGLDLPTTPAPGAA